MAQWAALTQQPKRALELYQDKDFPLDVRHYLASYIESRPWMAIPPDLAATEFQNLLQELDNKVLEFQNTGQVDLLIQSQKLSGCRVELMSKYGHQPELMVQSLILLLQLEHRILTTEFQQQQLSPMIAPSPLNNINTSHGIPMAISPVAMATQSVTMTTQPATMTTQPVTMTTQPVAMTPPSAMALVATNTSSMSMSHPQPVLLRSISSSGAEGMISMPNSPQPSVVNLNRAPRPTSLGPNSKPTTPSTPSISTALNNLDNWGQNAKIITQYIGNTKDILNRTSPNKRGALQNKMKRLQGNLDRHLHTMQQVQNFLTCSIQNTLDELSAANTRIIELIGEWRSNQRKRMIGYPDKSIDITTLEDKVKVHAGRLETCLQQIKLALRHFNSTKTMTADKDDSEYACITRMRDTAVDLIISLVKKSLLIEELPVSPILKKDTQFVVSLRLLVGGHFGLKINPPEVSSTLISSKSVSQIQDRRGVVSCGEILNGSNIMEYFSSTNSIKLFLRKLMLKKIQRGGSSDKAGENRYCLCFTSDVKLHLVDQEVFISTVSPSLALVVHTRQVALAEASIIWDNAFSSEGSTFPEKVPWLDVATVLSNWFQLRTGRGLSEENKKCLERKAFGSNVSSNLSWKQFAKDSLCDRSFTFWGWIYSAYDLIDKCLKALWRDGLLVGFIGKAEVEKLLSGCKPNTFILRFSDSQLGAISASWLHEAEGRPGEILHLQPNTYRGLSYISLAERIIGLPDLMYLYPDLPKKDVFEKYLEKQDVDATGAYVRQNISVSVDLPRHHLNSTTLCSPLNSVDDIDDCVFDYPEFSLSPNSELMNSILSSNDGGGFSSPCMSTPGGGISSSTAGCYGYNSVSELEPSLADLDLDSLINTAQNNLNSISSQSDDPMAGMNAPRPSPPNCFTANDCHDLEDFFN